MNIIEELEEKGVQKLELDIIERCWQKNISPPAISDIMGKEFNVRDIERIIPYFRHQKEIESDCETTSDEDIRIGMRLIKFYEHEFVPSWFVDLFDLPTEHIEGLYQEVEEEFKIIRSEQHATKVNH
jgi:hypothetical protein